MEAGGRDREQDDDDIDDGRKEVVVEYFLHFTFPFLRFLILYTIFAA